MDMPIASVARQSKSYQYRRRDLAIHLSDLNSCSRGGARSAASGFRGLLQLPRARDVCGLSLIVRRESFFQHLLGEGCKSERALGC